MAGGALLYDAATRDTERLNQITRGRQPVPSITTLKSMPQIPKRSTRTYQPLVTNLRTPPERNRPQTKFELPSPKRRRMYFEAQLDKPGVYGDPGTVMPQDIDEPFARDIAWQVRRVAEPGQMGPTADQSKVMESQAAQKFNINQPLGPIGLNEDRFAKLTVSAEDINARFGDPKPLRSIKY